MTRYEAEILYGVPGGDRPVGLIEHPVLRSAGGGSTVLADAFARMVRCSNCGAPVRTLEYDIGDESLLCRACVSAAARPSSADLRPVRLMPGSRRMADYLETKSRELQQRLPFAP